MTLIKKIMAAAAMVVAIFSAVEASAPSTAIDLNSPDVLLDEAKPKDARAVLFIDPVPGEVLKAQITFDPDLVDSLYDRPAHARFTNPQVQNAVAGLSHLYRRLTDVAGNVQELKTRLRGFIEAGHPLRVVFTLDYTHPTLDLSNTVNSAIYQQLSNTLRYQEYGAGDAGDLSREQAARQAVLTANLAKKATGADVAVAPTTRGSGGAGVVKPTAVRIPEVVPVDPTSAAVLRDDATLDDAMAVLLVKKTSHDSGVMYDIAFDSSVMLGLIPENTKAREDLRNLKTLLERFTNPDVRTFIEGMRQIYLNVMQRADASYDKAAFIAVLNQLNATSRPLVVPFKLNPSSEYSLDFQNPFSGHAEEGRKYDVLIESIKTRTNKFLAPGETRTLAAEYAARQSVIDGTSGKK